MRLRVRPGYPGSQSTHRAALRSPPRKVSLSLEECEEKKQISAIDRVAAMSRSTVQYHSDVFLLYHVAIDDAS